MTIGAERLESWIGAEVCDSGGEKLGKLEELFFRGDEPLVAQIRSGLGGRKHHAAVLQGATVTREHVRLAVSGDRLVATAGELDAATLDALAAQDTRLGEVELSELEGYTARKERLAAAAAARQRADELEAEAQRLARDEDKATQDASSAGDAAEQARKAREAAEHKAQAAREEASDSASG